MFLDVQKEIIGDPRLTSCAAMSHSGGITCSQCGCSYKLHQHIYYETTEVDDKKVDCNIETEINTTEQAKTKAKEVTEQLEQEIKRLEKLKTDLTKAMAKFAHFLKANALASVNDCIEKYIKQMIRNHEVLQARGGGNPHIIDQLNQDLARYIEEKV